MINRKSLHASFIEMRERQASINSRELTKFDVMVGDRIFQLAHEAMTRSKLHDDGMDPGERERVVMEVASIATGGGKSQSSCAFIAAAAKLDPEFSAAYIVPTVKMGIEAQQGIEALLGEGTTVLWTWCHKHKGRDKSKVKEELGYVPDRVVDRSDLPESKIVILTHKFLENETISGNDNGARRYMGRLRDVVFIDEHPELVEIVSATPASLLGFHDDLSRWDAQAEWLPLLSEVAGRMAQVMQAADKGFIVPQLLNPEDVEVLDGASVQQIAELIDEDLSSLRKQSEARKYYEIISFLKAAANSSCFYSKKDKTFFAYKLNFEPQPGFVLLDATADLHGLLELHPEIGIVKDVPQVNHKNLDVRYIKLPKGFRSVKDITKSRQKGEAYGRWIRRVVLANTQPGDDVLVVTHKDILGLHFVKPSHNIDTPADWEGRRVNTLNWGAGVGLNKWKGKTHVFLFGEFYQPRFKTISETHGWRQEPISESQLQEATAKKVGTNRYKPQGIYLNPFRGHLLRWSKQLAMRGSARNVSWNGVCAPMKLIVTTPLPDLLEHFERLFPGAPLPQPATKPRGVEDITDEPTGRDGLIELLVGESKAVVGADEVARRTGLRQDQLTREFKSDNVRSVAQAYGWTLRSAQEIGVSGRMRYLVNDRLWVSESTFAA